MSEREPRITDALKESITRHETRLLGMSRTLVHAHTHLQALTKLADKLKLHLEVQKTQTEKHKLQQISECEKPQEKSNKDEEDKEVYFRFPSVGASCDGEFLKMVESMVEGVLLISCEINIGKLARDLKGPSIQEDLLKWQQTVTVLQKYDDQVRRAIEYFQRQQDD